jgi:hypothetical protein
MSLKYFNTIAPAVAVKLEHSLHVRQAVAKILKDIDINHFLAWEFYLY